MDFVFIVIAVLFVMVYIIWFAAILFILQVGDE